MTKKHTPGFSAILISLTLGCLFTGAWVRKADPKKPNVVLFFIDDLGYGDLSCTGAMG